MSDIGKRVKSLLLGHKHGVLSVADRETHIPYGALVNYACDAAGLPIFLFSTLARHTQAVLAQPKASLLVSALPASGDILTGMRAAFMGKCVKLEQDNGLQAAYLHAHPYASGYIGFGDFGFWRLEPELIHTVAGFGQIATLPADEVFGA